ncbi:hypothetical protein D9M71_467470 [compost metagenome]
MVHPVLFDALHPHRLEGAGADVQGDERGFHALRADRLEQRLVEVQPGGGCGHRAGALGVDRLVALAVVRFVRTIDVGRQRHVADPLQQRQHFLGEAQLEQRVVALQHLRLAAALDEDGRARLGRFARTHVGQHAVAVQHAFDEDFQLAAGSLLAEQARRDHPGIVEHHQVARAQQFQHIGELPVRQFAARAVQHQQAAGAAFGERMAGDQVVGQVKMKIGDTHGGLSRRAAYLKGIAFF